MTSSRLILIFLGFIFVIIVILTSSKIAGALRSRFGGFFPPINTTTTETTEEISPAPTLVLSPDLRRDEGLVEEGQIKVTSTPSGNIPATGPAEVMWFLLFGSLLGGISLRKFSSIWR